MEAMPKMDHGDDECGMLMYFHFRYCESVVLFNGWAVKDVGTLIGTMIAFIAMAFLHETIRFYREHLYSKCTISQCDSKSDKTYGTSKQHLQSEEHSVKKRHAILSKLHLAQTGLHALQLIISYLLMLVFMTYNFYLCISVIIGSTIGYFSFAWCRTTRVSVAVEDCCH